MKFDILIMYKYIFIIILNKIKEFLWLNFETIIDENKIYKYLKYLIFLIFIIEILIACFIGYCLDFFLSNESKLIILNNKLIVVFVIFIISLWLVPKIHIKEKLNFIEDKSLVLS